ncbi:MAG: hypothetical protein AB1397_07755 [bacterium]
MKEIKPKLASELNRLWHSHLPRISISNIVRNTYWVCYGLFLGEEIYAIGIWTSPIAGNKFKDRKEILELRRLAVNDKCPKNTCSKMISLMIKKIRQKFPEIKRLISYQDTSCTLGTIYEASNWVATHKTKFASWSHHKRTRNPDQIIGDKIRWEYILKCR